MTEGRQLHCIRIDDKNMNFKTKPADVSYGYLAPAEAMEEGHAEAAIPSPVSIDTARKENTTVIKKKRIFFEFLRLKNHVKKDNHLSHRGRGSGRQLTVTNAAICISETVITRDQAPHTIT